MFYLFLRVCSSSKIDGNQIYGTKSEILESDEVVRYIGNSSNTSSFANNNSNNNRSTNTDIEIASSSCPRMLSHSSADGESGVVGFRSAARVAEFSSNDNTVKIKLDKNISPIKSSKTLLLEPKN